MPANKDKTPDIIIPASPPAKRHRGLKWAGGFCLILILVGSIFGNIVLGSLFVLGATSSHSGYEEQVYQGSESFEKDKIVEIELSGMISEDSAGSYLSSAPTTQSVMDQLDLAMSDDRVTAVVLRVDSPGGSVTASESLHQKIKEVRDAGKKVIAYIHSQGTSGAYYASVAADTIIANPTSINGSIGVIIQSHNYEELLKKVGVKTVTFKSGKYKDILSGSREMTPDERDIVQGIVDSSYKIFLDRVEEGRKIDRKKLVDLADGRIYTAEQAKEHKLIDEVGYENDAIEKAAELAGSGRYYVIRYTMDASFLDSLSRLPFVSAMKFVNNLVAGRSEQLGVFYL